MKKVYFLRVVLLFVICHSSLSVWSQDEMQGKLMMGYQGWFLARGDSSGPNEWRHWFRSTTNPSPENFTIDMWPDMTEYTVKYNTNMTYSDGSNAQLFSSHDLSTTRTHFKWMKDYNVHGVHLQRFLGEIEDPRFFQARNNVLQNVMTAAAEYDRHFSVMYDLSGVPDDGQLYNKLITDWEYLVDTYDVLNAQGYVKEDDRPVVALWGIGFRGRGLQAATFQAIIDYFHTNADPKYRAYVMGGVPDGWRTLSGSSESGSEWAAIYNSLDMISPWSVGRYGSNSGADNWKTSNIEPDLQRCNENGVDYMPVIWPGFSWLNLHDGPLNQIPRNKGEFYWRQAYNAISAGVKYIYVAMFDEVDEATAMFKIAENKEQLPVEAKEILVPLDADGTKLPSDWYLQLADQTQLMLEGSIALTPTIPIEPTFPNASDAEFVSQQNVPQTMELDEVVEVSVTMKNTGATTWTKSENFVLGSQSPEGNNNWKIAAVELSESDAIQPGEEKTFTFNIQAPLASGIIGFQWQMKQLTKGSFGDLSSQVFITVGGGGDYVDDCDSKDEWNPNSLVLNTTDQLQGVGCLQHSGSSTDEFSKAFSEPYNSSVIPSEAVLQFWYYVSDISVLNSENQVELGSSGRADQNEYNWSLTGLQVGWNLVQLKISDAGVIGSPDLNNINWFRLYRFKSGSNTTRIDAIQIIRDPSLGVDDISKNVQWSVYPNPAENLFNLSINISQSTNVKVTLLNMLGQKVYQSNNEAVNPGNYTRKVSVNHLKSGTYFMKINVNATNFYKKIVVK
ncbi:T9SS type A sorting domain-containing protein [Tamlana fucoidanivorans]|uniref:T9SS type A sorting domain-containing protein n=1 Tax=Allotamlana fucoidanivorans TaxID=2583814 RepID=A0A5C4SMD7_9FLAO|nr:T9SS type A sorting domain-containing protein [Tamlana fucoidanivorans]TNJ44908.1 T9SS type A sorting domain-containing protein [Tamlana fucoidanivorans]